MRPFYHDILGSAAFQNLFNKTKHNCYNGENNDNNFLAIMKR